MTWKEEIGQPLVKGDVQEPPVQSVNPNIFSFDDLDKLNLGGQEGEINFKLEEKKNAEEANSKDSINSIEITTLLESLQVPKAKGNQNPNMSRCHNPEPKNLF